MQESGPNNSQPSESNGSMRPSGDRRGQFEVGGIQIAYDPDSVRSAFQENKEEEVLADAFAIHATLSAGVTLFDEVEFEPSQEPSSYSIHDIVKHSDREDTFRSRLVARNILRQLGIDVSDSKAIQLTDAQLKIVLGDLNPYRKETRQKKKKNTTSKD